MRSTIDLSVNNDNVSITKSPQGEVEGVYLVTMRHRPTGISASMYWNSEDGVTTMRKFDGLGEMIETELDSYGVILNKLARSLSMKIKKIGPPVIKRALGPSYAFTY